MFHCLFRTRAFLIFGLVVSLLHTHLWAYQPKDAKVQAILNKAIAYLEAQPTDPKTERIAGSAAVTPQQWNTMMGYKMLIAYAIYKHRKNKNHPKVKAAIASAVEAMNADPVKMGRKAVYELGVAISFLTEFDDPQIDQLVVKMYNHLLTHQKSNGSFAYGGDGDTSLTQYAILAMWSVKEANLIPNFDNGPVERACNWLMRTQGVSGNWAYHGKDPGTFKRVPQTFEATLSTFVAGAGSLYITADILGFHKQTTSSDTPFTSVNSARTRGNRPTTTAVSEQYLWESLSLADLVHQRSIADGVAVLLHVWPREISELPQ